MKSTLPADSPPSQHEALGLLEDTARAVKVMKASWLRVALNLKQVRKFDLWRYAKPKCENYEDYVLGVLKLNKYVANRMLRAMDYTAERRPEIIQDYMKRGEEAEIPSFDVVDQLRRVEPAFAERGSEFRDLESRVFDEGVGRVHLKREIDEKLGRSENVPDPEAGSEPEPVATVADVLEELKILEKKLLRLKVSKDARRLMFQLVETLEKEKLS